MSTRSEASQALRSHFMQELGLDLRPGNDVWKGEALVPEGACVPGSRFPRASTLLMYADVVAGGLVRTRTLPQLSVTVDLTLDVLDPEAPRSDVPELVVSSRILRAGKRLVFIETTLSTPQGGLVAVCTGCFSVISRTLNAFGDAGVERAPRHERPLLAMPIEDRVGLKVLSPGTTEIARRSDLGNSTDSLMGGLHALLGEAATLSRVEVDDPTPRFVDGIQVRYLAPVRVGPARATVALLGGSPSRRIARVEVGDASTTEHLAADITASCVPWK